ncbi:hypothetical protein H2O73_15365 [Vibrio sp. 404]|uniref:Oxidase n=1 Tax=Vibrio marinisediminis TaxID=2758441 RepID=A0A7W2FT31_9VIBR|nr:hypothetical protein [Vibrio marinisediminis]MBA5763742.1 hypothetical protein [Vibrio marinisediminis]
MYIDIRQWFNPTKKTLSFLYLPALCILVGAVVVSVKMGVPISVLTQDPLSSTGQHPFTGAISNLGIVLWAFSGSVCIFTYCLLKNSSIDRARNRFILLGAIISCAFLFDDLFMLHEWIFPKLLGLNEKIVLIFYAFLLLYYVVAFRGRILSRDITLLLFFFVGLAISVLIDMVPDTYFTWHYLLEDGPKFLGIVSWFGYQFTTCMVEIRLVQNSL